MDLQVLLEPTLAGLGYELVNVELGRGGGLVRVFIDKPGGVNVDDCALVSNHLTRLFAVEHYDYERLEVSSPGLDRILKRPADFVRFAGEKARVKLRVPLKGQRNFVGVLRDVNDGMLQMEVEGALVSFDLNNLESARLVPSV